ncbi:uncharacterized protein [Littorina saxatilis]|uniref:Uncharacterized protein n=1 Tax=Littorina saxatilis TaxID=31220 RepID=A0AAN9GEB3_9CAEN
MSATKAQNDPWSPLPQDSNGISPPPADPRHQLIDSARYIDSLEKRLKKVQGKQRPEPSSRQIIDSLASFREDQMQRFMNRDQNGTSVLLSSADTDSESAVSGSVAYIQRKLHPEKQAINMEELFELLKDDELARIRAENEDKEEKEKDRSKGSTVPNEEEQEKEKEKDSSTGSSVPNEADRQEENSDSVGCGDCDAQNPSVEENKSCDDSASSESNETDANQGER